MLKLLLVAHLDDIRTCTRFTNATIVMLLGVHVKIKFRFKFDLKVI